MVCGMAPGNQELNQGKPFIGGSGKILWSLAKQHGLDRSDCDIVNVLNCYPLGKGGAPSPEQLALCRERFDNDMRSSKAEVILALGGDAFKRITGTKRGITDSRGYMFSPEDCKPVKIRVQETIEYKTSKKCPECKDILFNIDPKAQLKMEWEVPGVILKSLEMGHIPYKCGTCKGSGWKYQKGDPRVVNTTQEVEPALPVNLRWIIPSLHPAAIMREGLKTIPALNADLERAIRVSKTDTQPLDITFLETPTPLRGSISLDLETSIATGSIERVGLSDGERTWTHEWDAATREKVREEMSDETRIKIAHNWQFDLPKLEDNGLEVPGKIFDTMLAAHLLQPDLYKALGRCSTLYLDLRAWKHLSSDSPAYYNAADVLITHKMFSKQWDMLDRTGMLLLFTETIMPATRVLMAMTKRGIKVDPERLEKWHEELSDKSQKLLVKWSSLVGDINPFSPPQLKRYLYKTLGLPEQHGKYGGVTTDEGALKTLREKYPEKAGVIGLLLDIREVNKLKSTYAEIDISDDGCLHPSYLPTNKDTDKAGAATGRLTSFIHTQPMIARRLYVPHEKGMVFLEADFSQIELRIAASLAGEGRLLEALETGDVHGETMRLLGCDRVRAKNVIYGTLYGAGPKKLAILLKQNGVWTTESECRDLQSKLAKAYPDLWAWRTEVGSEAAQRRYLTNPFGRRRYFYGGSRDVPQAIDYLPQSCASDILWACLVPLESGLNSLDARLVTTVHDSVLCEIPRDKVDQATQVLREVMEQDFTCIAPGFKVPINITRGTSWGEMR